MIDLSDCHELSHLAEVIAALRRNAPECNPLLVGAMARDVLLWHTHGIQPSRATADIDIAFAVANWGGYEEIRTDLLAGEEFSEDPLRKHRLLFREILGVDLLPFGGIENEDRTIAWPPRGDFIMTMLGFREAMSHAKIVRLPRSQSVSVVSLSGLAVLKLVAWHERHLDKPRLDAGDLWLTMRHFLDAGNADRIYEEASHLLDDPEFDLDRASAWFLGHDARDLLLSGNDADHALARLEGILNPEIDINGPLQLAREMKSSDPESALSLLFAFRAGLMGENTPG